MDGPSVWQSGDHSNSSLPDFCCYLSLSIYLPKNYLALHLLSGPLRDRFARSDPLLSTFAHVSLYISKRVAIHSYFRTFLPLYHLALCGLGDSARNKEKSLPLSCRTSFLSHAFRYTTFRITPYPLRCFAMCSSTSRSAWQPTRTSAPSCRSTTWCCSGWHR